jgi:hypothetical protein
MYDNTLNSALEFKSWNINKTGGDMLTLMIFWEKLNMKKKGNIPNIESIF